MGGRFAARAGPCAQHFSGSSCPSAVALVHTKTKAIERCALQLPFSVLRRGDTQGNNVNLLALTGERQQAGERATQSVAVSCGVFFVLYVSVIFMDREGSTGTFLNWWQTIYGT